MDNKHDRKKESIDEILSDLNGLLNKMPSILDGIKMPEMQPAEYVKPAEVPEPQAPKPEPKNDVPAEPFDAEKTVVLESFSGLSEGAQAPEELPSFQAADADSPAEEEKPPVIESFPGPQEAAPAREQEKLAVQSLGDFMFGEEAQAEKPAAAGPVKLSGAPLEPPSEEPVRNVASGPSLSISEFTPPVPDDNAPAAAVSGAEAPVSAFPEAGLPGIPEPAPDEMTFSRENEETQAGAGDHSEPSGQLNEQAPAAFNAEETEPEKQPAPASFETSRDFGVPDIDVLMQMSEAEKPAAEPSGQPLPEAGLNPGAAPETDGPALAGGFPEAFDAASTQAEPEFPAAGEEVPAAAGPEMEKSGMEEPGAASAAMEPGDFVIEPEAKPEEKSENSFEAFTFDPASSEPAPAQDGGETLRLEPAPQSPETPAAEPQPAEAQPVEPEFAAFAEPAAEPKLEAGPEVQFGASAEPAPEPAPEAEPKLEVGEGLQFGSVAEPAAGSGIELAPGIELGGGSPVSFGSPDETLPGIAPVEQTPSGDETLVIAPGAGSSGEEEKTVIFQAGPSSTARAQAGDLASLSGRQQPEGIPPERVRSIAFLYSQGDETLCASVLAEMDAICLKSAAKPMYIKRAYVKVCEADANANFVSQSVTDSGAIGLVCVGAIPQEKVYEIENALSSAGGFFRYFDSSSFSHSSALDLVADLIIR